MKTFKERFTEKVAKSKSCWIWIGASDGKGYGITTNNKQRIFAHRASYMLFVGKIPKGLFVLHKCDNPPCVNPSHLFVGTQLDNMRDAVRKGRHKNNPLKGSKNPLAKLTETDIPKIRKLYSDGMRQAHIAKKFNVSPATIWEIRVGRKWKHV